MTLIDLDHDLADGSLIFNSPGNSPGAAASETWLKSQTNDRVAFDCADWLGDTSGAKFIFFVAAQGLIIIGTVIARIVFQLNPITLV